MEKKVKVLFVCTGNICRSPTAEAVFRHLVKIDKLHDRIIADSAGVASYHIGEGSDERAVRYAKSKGIDMTDIRARQISKNDFKDYDMILAMAHTHQHTIYGLRPSGDEYQRAKLYLFLDFVEDIADKDVPDPYYGGIEDFKKVFELTVLGSKCLLNHIKNEYLNDSY